MTQLKIDALGALGDGIVRAEGQITFVPFALPGEVVETGTAELPTISEPSAHRQEPVCQHFGSCGGCVAQHMDSALYLGWKQDIVADAFQRVGLDAEIEPVFSVSANSRRRTVFSAVQGDDGVTLGFHRRNSDSVLDLQQCAVATLAIETALPDLRKLVATLLRGAELAQVSVLEADQGLDLAIDVPLDPGQEMLAAFVRALSRSPFVRAAVNGDVVFERAQPTLTFGEAAVSIPPGAFVQAVAQAQDKMIDLVETHLKKAKTVADLFAGSGTFALPLSRTARVHAYESEREAVETLTRVPQPKRHKPVSAKMRDLYEAPLSTRELRDYDGVCLDPPRAGAEDQVRNLAKSTIARLAYVSCNPVTLARDVKILVDGGYTIERVLPVDQFVFSHHVEVVALLSKPESKKPVSIFKKR